MNNTAHSSTVGPAEPSPTERLLACADLLACPQCGGPLTAPADPARPDRTLRCPHGHSFDLAKQGYVSLLTGASTKMTGDTPAMLDARAAFQSAGHFAPIAAALAAAIAAIAPGPATAPETGFDTAVFGAESATAALPAEDRPGPDHNPGEADATPRGRRHRAGITAPGSSALAASALRVTAMLATGSERLAAGAGPITDPNPIGVVARPLDGEAHPRAPLGGDGVHDPAAGGRGPGVLEIGAGTGYYLAAVLDGTHEARGIALDVSKAAARRAARAHARAGAVLADAWRGLPVPNGAMSAVVSVFAPRNADEVARVLAADGRFVVVTPTPRHLRELVGPLDMVSVDAAKADRLAGSLGERFELVGREPVEYPMSLTHADVANVVAMGPSAFHGDAGRAEAIAALPDPVAVTASVTVSVYRKR